MDTDLDGMEYLHHIFLLWYWSAGCSELHVA